MTSKSCTRKTLAVLFSGALAVGTITALTAPATASGSPPTRAPAAGQAVGQSAKPSSDDLPDPLSDKQAALREEAISDVLSGKRKAQKIDGEQVVKMGKEPATPAQPNPQTFNNPQSGDDGQAAPQSGSSAAKGRQDQYVQLSREKSDNLFVILVDFGNKRHENYPDEDSDPATPGPEKFNGPQHGNFPAPDRSVDNTTVYDPPFNKKHYKNLYFSDKDGANSLKNYYQKQSSGRYSVDGEVAGWVRVPYNEARYGRNVSFDADGNVVCEDIVCPNVWKMIEDGIDSWVAKKHDEGMSTEQIKAELSKFDQWDRNDYDGDGDFNEPDGYLDHFQILHAGGGEAAGSPAGYGEDAIWS
ncbi:MAG: immune inhibitor A domain-containing protein, partial [Nocardioidaceae bacterium]